MIGRLLNRRTVSGVAVAAMVIGLALAATASQWQPARAADAAVTWQLDTNANNTVNAGDTVTWTWGDGLPHSLTSVTGPATFDSGVQTGAGSSFAFTFTQPGTYTYRCIVHPSTMTGTVTVQGATTTTTPAATATTPAATATTPAATATTPAATATAPAATATTPPATATTPANTPTTPLAGASKITLTGSEEVPPVTTSATGQFEWKLEGDTLRFRLTATGGNFTAAHIHNAAKGANGPIVVPLFGPASPAASSIDAVGTITTASLTGTFAGKMPEFLAALRAGNLYVNVHSTDHPAGVLRGQIPATPAAPSTGTSSNDSDGGMGVSLEVLALLVTLAGAMGIGAVALAARRR